MEKVAGIASKRVLPPYARQRFSTWWRKRRAVDGRRQRGAGPAGQRHRLPDVHRRVPDTHLRAQNVGLKSRDLVKLTGASIRVVAECSGIDGTWGYRRDNYAASRRVASKMGKAIDNAGGDVVVGDCHLANGGIVHDLVTLLFENGQTVRFQIQEMARAEKLISDEAIEAELRIYNPLIPEPGQLCATLFIELTSKDALVEWLPKLVGIEGSVAVRLADGEVVRAVVDEDHGRRLTRDEVTASVHYVRWVLRPDQEERFAAGGVTLVAEYPAYRADAPLADDTVAELAGDLRGGG